MLSLSVASASHCWGAWLGGPPHACWSCKRGWAFFACDSAQFAALAVNHWQSKLRPLTLAAQTATARSNNQSNLIWVFGALALRMPLISASRRTLLGRLHKNSCASCAFSLRPVKFLMSHLQREGGWGRGGREGAQGQCLEAWREELRGVEGWYDLVPPHHYHYQQQPNPSGSAYTSPATHPCGPRWAPPACTHLLMRCSTLRQ